MKSLAGHQRHRRAAIKRLGEAVKAIALCHNVTPVHEIDPGKDLCQLFNNHPNILFYCNESCSILNLMLTRIIL